MMLDCIKNLINDLDVKVTIDEVNKKYIIKKTINLEGSKMNQIINDLSFLLLSSEIDDIMYRYLPDVNYEIKKIYLNPPEDEDIHITDLIY
jgi:hypothetical protein